MAAGAALALGLALAGTVAVLLLRGGSGSGAVNPARAGEVAASMLLDGPSLPGKGWTIEEDEPLTKASATGTGVAPTAPESAECSAQHAFERALAGMDDRFAGGASRLLARPGEGLTGVSVTDTLFVFQDAAGAAAAVTAAKEAIGSDTLPRCLEQSAAEANLQVTATRVAAATAAPSPGAEAAFRLTETSGGDPQAVVLQVFWWSRANTVANVIIAGPEAEVTTAMVKSTVGSARAAMAAKAQ